jgi:hypothetical protein
MIDEPPVYSSPSFP